MICARANIDVTKGDNNGKVIFGCTVKVQDLDLDKIIIYKLVGQDRLILKNLIFKKVPLVLIGKDKVIL